MNILSNSLALLALIAAVSFAGAAQSEPADAGAAFDADLAQSLGADDYGMRTYVLVILKTGPAEITDEARRKELFAGHFSNMARLAEDGKLAVAGPFIEGGEKRGLYIFNVADIAEAQALVETDPAVAAGIFTPELTKFYGSAALMTVNETHLKIQKKSVE